MAHNRNIIDRQNGTCTRMAALPWNQISSIDQICHKSPSYAQILISKLKVDMTCSHILVPKRKIPNIVTRSTGAIDIHNYGMLYYIFHDYWVTLQKIHLFSNVFTLSGVKKTWSEITLKVFQTLTGVSEEHVICNGKYSTPRAHTVFQ